jgi:ABC-type uncharacterized transport system ATPase subunit
MWRYADKINLFKQTKYKFRQIESSLVFTRLREMQTEKPADVSIYCNAFLEIQFLLQIKPNLVLSDSCD